MLIEVKVPQLSESVSEATLVTWHKKEGEAVARDQNLIDIETDKKSYLTGESARVLFKTPFNGKRRDGRWVGSIRILRTLWSMKRRL